MGQIAIHDEGHDLHVAVRVLSEAPLALHEVVVHHPQHAEATGAVAILREAEVEARLQPVLVGPALAAV